MSEPESSCREKKDDDKNEINEQSDYILKERDRILFKKWGYKLEDIPKSIFWHFTPGHYMWHKHILSCYHSNTLEEFKKNLGCSPELFDMLINRHKYDKYKHTTLFNLIYELLHVHERAYCGVQQDIYQPHIHYVLQQIADEWKSFCTDLWKDYLNFVDNGKYENFQFYKTSVHADSFSTQDFRNILSRYKDINLNDFNIFIHGCTFESSFNFVNYSLMGVGRCNDFSAIHQNLSYLYCVKDTDVDYAIYQARHKTKYNFLSDCHQKYYNTHIALVVFLIPKSHQFNEIDLSRDLDLWRDIIFCSKFDDDEEKIKRKMKRELQRKHKGDLIYGPFSSIQHHDDNPFKIEKNDIRPYVREDVRGGKSRYITQYSLQTNYKIEDMQKLLIYIPISEYKIK